MVHSRDLAVDWKGAGGRSVVVATSLGVWGGGDEPTVSFQFSPVCLGGPSICGEDVHMRHEKSEALVMPQVAKATGLYRAARLANMMIWIALVEGR